MQLGAVAAALSTLALAACTLATLRDDAGRFYASTALVGRVSAPATDPQPIIVAAYRDRGAGLEIAHRALLREPGAYELVVPKGEFALFAFRDSNGNLRYDAGEPAGAYQAGATIAASGDGVIADLDIALSRAPARVPAGTSFATAEILRDTQAGVVSRLDDPIFGPEYAQRGYWAPMAFFRELGGNVHFIEPYDPAKTPVLFVHGAAGSPRDWQAIAAGIDRSRFQPWFYYYPSGASIDSMAYLLLWKLHSLQVRYGFGRIHIVAHSMGGLVARRFLTLHGAAFPYVTLFVSISTPWGGESLAELGVRASPAVVPSWRDMQPSGEFMRTQFERKLPAAVDYYLLFGHRDGASLFRPANDGAVTLESQLAPQAQAEARMVYGYNEGHVSILSSPQVIAQLRALLAGSGEAPGARGRIRVEFRLPGGGVPRSRPLLLLTPADGGPRITLPLNPEDSGREVGPFPAGAYDASLIANAYASAPRSIPLAVEPGRSTTMGFRLMPQGVLAGFVAAPVGTAPAGAYRGASVEIESATLTGAGVYRRVAPIPGADPATRYLDGADHVAGAYFSFVGLPEGTYKLTVSARGYRPHVDSYRVVPGEYGPFRPIVLEPLP